MKRIIFLVIAAIAVIAITIWFLRSKPTPPAVIEPVVVVPIEPHNPPVGIVEDYIQKMPSIVETETALIAKNRARVWREGQAYLSLNGFDTLLQAVITEPGVMNYQPTVINDDLFVASAVVPPTSSRIGLAVADVHYRIGSEQDTYISYFPLMLSDTYFVGPAPWSWLKESDVVFTGYIPNDSLTAMLAQRRIRRSARNIPVEQLNLRGLGRVIIVISWAWAPEPIVTAKAITLDYRDSGASISLKSDQNEIISGDPATARLLVNYLPRLLNAADRVGLYGRRIVELKRRFRPVIE